MTAMTAMTGREEEELERGCGTGTGIMATRGSKLDTDTLKISNL
jgi:hypothetical protein